MLSLCPRMIEATLTVPSIIVGLLVNTYAHEQSLRY